MVYLVTERGYLERYGNMNLGANIKRLRREQNVTQEELAEHLGVTPQAVSGWECERNSPDITALPLLASIFNTSVDELLGVNVERNSAEIDAVINEARDKRKEGYTDAALSCIRMGLAKHPNSHKLMGELAEYLYMSVYPYDCSDKPNTPELNEAAAVCDLLIDKCTDISVKAEAIRTRSLLYDRLGQRDKAISTAMLLPEIDRNDILGNLYTGDKLVSFIKENMLENISASFIDCAKLAECTATSGKSVYTSEEKIAIYEKIIACYEVLFEAGDYNFFAQFPERAYKCMAEIYAEFEDKENTLECLDKAVNFGIMFCTYPEDAVQTSMLFRGIEYGGWVKSCPGDTADQIRQILKDIEDDKRFDFVRNENRYKDIAEKVYAAVKSFDA